VETEHRPVEWEVDVGPPERAPRIQVPDCGLQAFLRALASQGISEFRITSGLHVFLITRVGAAPHSTESEPAGPQSKRLADGA